MPQLLAPDLVDLGLFTIDDFHRDLTDASFTDRHRATRQFLTKLFPESCGTSMEDWNTFPINNRSPFYGWHHDDRGRDQILVIWTSHHSTRIVRPVIAGEENTTCFSVPVQDRTEVVLKPSHMYAFDNQKWAHQSPPLEKHQLETRWFFRTNVSSESFDFKRYAE